MTNEIKRGEVCFWKFFLLCKKVSAKLKIKLEKTNFFGKIGRNGVWWQVKFFVSY